MRYQLNHLLFFCCVGLSVATLRIPFLSKKNQYTPLVFFTVPKDTIPACDEMETVVSEVERELGVRVERLDILKDPHAEATMSVLTQRRPPLLYNRESCQVVYVPGVSDRVKKEPAPIDKDRVRAWAKGRFLNAQTAAAAKSKAPIVLAQEDNSIDQADLIEDMTLTPMQKSGKEAIKKRTAEKAEKQIKAKAE
jgi:hypothetical protein